MLAEEYLDGLKAREIEIYPQKREGSSYATIEGLLSTVFNVSKEDVATAISSESWYMEARQKWMNWGDCMGSTFLKCVNALVKAGLVRCDQDFPVVKFIVQYSNKTTPSITTMCFCKGHLLSQIDKRTVHGVEECGIIGCDWEPCDIVRSDTIILLLDAPLEIDCHKRLYHCKIKGMKLRDIDWTTSIVVEDGDTLFIDGTVHVVCSNPIDAEGEIRILGTPGSTLVLENTDGMQPCIGCHTLTDLSYDRWAIAYGTCSKIIVEGVRVICKSVNGNFMLGEYGTNQIPAVECVDGGSLDAIEITGKRSMVKKPVYYSGSTKLDTYPEYEIQRDGE